MIDLNAKPMLSRDEIDGARAIAEAMMHLSGTDKNLISLETEMEMAMPLALLILAGIEALDGRDEVVGVPV